jgi:hypothetical protein
MTEHIPTYCANHPTIETSLRCNRCEKYICPKCAVKAPVGYRCKECVREQQKSFDTAAWYDYLSGFIVGAILSAIASFLIGLLGSIGFIGWFLVVAAAPTAGVAVAEAVRFVIQRHRARSLFMTILAAVALGALPAILLRLLTLDIFGLVFQAIYLAMAIPTIYTRLSGIQLFK